MTSIANYSLTTVDRTPWWRTTKDNLAERIFSAVDFLDNQQPYNRERNLRSLRLYSDHEALGFSSGTYSKPEMGQFGQRPNKMTLNVVRSVVDAAVNRIGNRRTRPFALTFQGDFSQQKKAKRLNQFMMGQFNISNVYDAGQEALTDSGITGTGIVKNYEIDGRIICERVFINELRIDDQEAIYGNPRQMFQVRTIPKDVIRGSFPEAKFKGIIDDCGIIDNADIDPSQSLSDLGTIIEAWHLPCKPGATDGRHTIAVSSGVLFDEPWDLGHFGLSFIRWGRRRIGFWGAGLADNLQGIQLEINLILRKIQTLMRLATSHVFIHKGSKIVKSHLSNEDWGVIEYVGQQPIFATVQAVSPEYFAHLDRLYQRAFEQSGVSELAATGKKPAGLNSGKALLEFSDIQSIRFSLVEKDLDEFYLDIADQQIALAKKIYERDGSYAVVTSSGRKMDLVNWSEIDMDRDKFILQVYPTAFLPQTPAGKWEQIAQMVEVGVLTSDEVSQLLDYPDLESITSLRNSPIQYAELVIETMVEKGRYLPPDPHSNLELNLRMVTFALLRAQLNDVPEERLELLRQYITDTDAILKELAAMAQQAQIDQVTQAQQLAQPPPPPIEQQLAQLEGQAAPQPPQEAPL